MWTLKWDIRKLSLLYSVYLTILRTCKISLTECTIEKLSIWS